MKHCLFIFFFLLSAVRTPAQQSPVLLYPELLSRVDTICNDYLCLDRYTTVLQTFRELLDSSRYSGLNKYAYHYAALYEQPPTPVALQERLLADGLLGYFTDLCLGDAKTERVSYDAVGLHTASRTGMMLSVACRCCAQRLICAA
jgi:hypothetical protein